MEQVQKKRGRPKTDPDKRVTSNDFVTCKVCGMRLRHGNMTKHKLKSPHHKRFANESERITKILRDILFNNKTLNKDVLSITELAINEHMKNN